MLGISTISMANNTVTIENNEKENIIGIDSFERQENTYEDKELEKAVKKFYPNSQIVIRRHPIAFGERGYDIRATVTLKNKEDFIRIFIVSCIRFYIFKKFKLIYGQKFEFF